jgi:hypothetical protein
MKKIEIAGSTELHYAYGLIMVFDRCETKPHARWTQQHEDQGFARRERSVLFSTLRQEGLARVSAFEGWPEDLNQGARIIQVPLNISSGNLNVQGLEEWPIERSMKVKSGLNTVVLSQRIDPATEQLVLEFYIDPVATESSKILKAGGLVKIPPELLETTDPI